MEEKRIEWTVVDETGEVVAQGHGEYISAALAMKWIEYLEKTPSLGNNRFITYVAK